MAKASRSGMTLVETMVVVALISLLATLAVPGLFRSRQYVQATKLIVDLRALNDAFGQHYLFQGGVYPPDAEEAQVPEGFESYSPKGFDWSKPTNIGGRWEWDRAQSPQDKVHGMCYACVRINSPQRTSVQMAGIDRRIDDGDLNSGRFRRASNGYILIIQE